MTILGILFFMKAMFLENIQNITDKNEFLVMRELKIPEPSENQIRIKVLTCGVCHTEIDEIEGRTPPETLPIVPGHQVVGIVDKKGKQAERFNIGDKVGVGWIYSTCSQCEFCNNGMENLCNSFKATGRDSNGGYAEYMVINENYACTIPADASASLIAPLLCAGAIGFRSLSLCNLSDGDRLGLTGFGASAHLVLKIIGALYPSTQVYVFARSRTQREFASELGAVWTGDITDKAPFGLKAIIDTTPVWKPVVESLKNLEKGGRLVINAIRKENSDIAYLKNLDYGEHLWNEKEIKSVANVTRKDIENLISCVTDHGITPEITEYRLEDATKALREIKEGDSKGAKVLKISA